MKVYMGFSHEEIQRLPYSYKVKIVKAYSEVMSEMFKSSRKKIAPRRTIHKDGSREYNISFGDEEALIKYTNMATTGKDNYDRW